MSKYNSFTSASDMNNLTPLKYPDCKFLTEQCKCGILDVGYCIGRKCSFNQSKNKYATSGCIRDKRLNSLDKAAQEKISNIYYGGKMPWKNES